MKIVNLWSLVVVFNITVFVTLLGHAQIPNSKPVEGLQDNTPSTTVLRGGRIVVSAEQIIENGDVIIQDNLIRKVGENQRIPAGAKIIELDGWCSLLKVPSLQNLVHSNWTLSNPLHKFLFFVCLTT